MFAVVFGRNANVRWLIGGTIGISFACALTMRLIVAEKGFDTFGKSLWWAVQTVTTVGYGDEVPQTSTGKGLAALLMVVGVAFVSVLTATVTAGLVERRRRDRPEDPINEALDVLKRIEQRLDAVERRD